MVTWMVAFYDPAQEDQSHSHRTTVHKLFTSSAPGSQILQGAKRILQGKPKGLGWQQAGFQRPGPPLGGTLCRGLWSAGDTKEVENGLVAGVALPPDARGHKRGVPCLLRFWQHPPEGIPLPHSQHGPRLCQ